MKPTDFQPAKGREETPRPPSNTFCSSAVPRNSAHKNDKSPGRVEHPLGTSLIYSQQCEPSCYYGCPRTKSLALMCFTRLTPEYLQEDKDRVQICIFPLESDGWLMDGSSSPKPWRSFFQLVLFLKAPQHTVYTPRHPHYTLDTAERNSRFIHPALRPTSAVIW